MARFAFGLNQFRLRHEPAGSELSQALRVVRSRRPFRVRPLGPLAGFGSRQLEV